MKLPMIPLPPLIPSSGNFSNLSVDYFKNNILIDGLTQKGSFRIVSGTNIIFTANDFLQPVIIRNSLASPSTDALPNPEDIANELGIINPEENDSYIKQIIIFIDDNKASSLTTSSPSPWTFYGVVPSPLPGDTSVTFVYQIKYTSGRWIGTILPCGKIFNN